MLGCMQHRGLQFADAPHLGAARGGVLCGLRQDVDVIEEAHAVHAVDVPGCLSHVVHLQPVPRPSARPAYSCGCCRDLRPNMIDNPVPEEASRLHNPCTLPAPQGKTRMLQKNS